VNEAYVVWATAHPDRECPASLAELEPYMATGATRDPWGNPYFWSCGRNMVPAGVYGLWVVSAGEDGQFGTADDVRSDR
jgi:hypothetical protein